jgi:2-dehydro-3-deoxyphosphogluconate aldolase / (4S)-4-hydroxy-2-oxoglutarate aldolase
MSPSPWLSLLQQHRFIPVIRTSNRLRGLKMAHAVASGGMQFIEITWNSDGAGELITKLRSELPQCTIGCGTVLNLLQMQQAIDAGVQFIFTPHVEAQMIQTAVNSNIPIVPGALTPTEIVTAWGLGASCVKVFPVQAVGGVNYIKSLQGPLGHIPLIPTGGVTIENAQDFLQAGAIAVGLSSDLFPKHSLDSENWDAITQKAKALQKKLLLTKG